MVSVALVSTFPPTECGIGNYSRELVTALARAAPDVRVDVVAEHTQPHDATVIRAWDRDSDWSVQAVAAIDAVRPHIVHVQHEEAIFGNRRLVGFLRALRLRGIRSVVTLHTVHESRRMAGFHRDVASVCDRVVAHQRSGMAAVLEEHGVAADQIELIAHGTPELQLPDRAAARNALELPADVPIALFFGFIHYGKALHVAVNAFERAYDRLGDARFVIAGRVRNNHVLDSVYIAWLRQRMSAGVAAGRLIFRPGFVPAEHKASYFGAADVIVLPHDQAYGSASGVLHEAIAARRPILCTHGKKFAEAFEAFGIEMPEMFPPPGDLDAWEQGFERLLLDDERRERASTLIAGMVERTSWTASARAHAQMYRDIYSNMSASRVA